MRSADRGRSEPVGAELSDRDRERLRTTFDQVADRYFDARPDYPERLFDRIFDLTGLMAGDQVLEVGAGPGKATVPLARRGLRVTALEPGAALAAEAARNLVGFDVDVVRSRLEDFDGAAVINGRGEYAAVVSATAWHWVDPAVRYAAAARALRPGGHLIIWAAEHVFPVGGDPFFEQIQPVYDDIEGSQPGAVERPAPGELAELSDEITASGRFELVAAEHLDWTLDYDADGYIALLSTFSGHIAMAVADRDHLFSEIRRRLAERPDGRLRRGWGSVLHVARLREPG